MDSAAERLPGAVAALQHHELRTPAARAVGARAGVAVAGPSIASHRAHRHSRGQSVCNGDRPAAGSRAGLVRDRHGVEGARLSLEEISEMSLGDAETRGRSGLDGEDRARWQGGRVQSS